jgi:hypothetical protein
MTTHDHDPALPWGHWLRLKAGSPSMLLVDEEGREWRSLREAFFHGQLGFAVAAGRFREAELERILAFLLASDRNRVGGPAIHSTIDLCGNSDELWRFYILWLTAQGLLGNRYTSDALAGELTDEGRAVAKMLLATRPTDLAAFHPGVEAFLYAEGKTKEIDRPAFQRPDQGVAHLTHVFVRERLHDHPAISLIFRDLGGRIPLIRTLWVQTFTTEACRDGYFEWMSERIDRWNAWGEMAYRKGAALLTQHLLATLAEEIRLQHRNVTGDPQPLSIPFKHEPARLTTE